MTESAVLKDRLTVKVNGEEREFFMSYGLLNALCNTIGAIENIGAPLIDPEIREEMMKVMLAPRKASGKLIADQEFDIDDVEISKDDTVTLVGWGTEHVLDFFTKAVEKTRDISSRNAEKLKALTSSMNGSGNSAS